MGYHHFLWHKPKSDIVGIVDKFRCPCRIILVLLIDIKNPNSACLLCNGIIISKLNSDKEFYWQENRLFGLLPFYFHFFFLSLKNMFFVTFAPTRTKKIKNSFPWQKCSVLCFWNIDRFASSKDAAFVLLFSIWRLNLNFLPHSTFLQVENETSHPRLHRINEIDVSQAIMFFFFLLF